MQVNQSTSPNFGQLKVVKTPELLEGLKKEKIEVLNKVKEAGEKLKDTKFYNVLLKSHAKTGEPCLKLESPQEAYFGQFESKNLGRICFDNNSRIMGINSVYGVGRHLSDREGRVEYNVWGLANVSYDKISDIDALTKIALELDEAAVAKYNEEVTAKVAAAAYQKEVDTLADGIFEKFGEYI